MTRQVLFTQGVFEVDDVHHNEMEKAKLIEYAALAECASSHPISKSLQRAYGKEPDRSRVSNIQEISGNGVIAKVDDVEVAAGNDKLMRMLNIDSKIVTVREPSFTWQSMANMQDILLFLTL